MRSLALLALGCLCAAVAVASDAATRARAAEVMRNWSPANQASSEAYITIAERRYRDGEQAFNLALQRSERSD